MFFEETKESLKNKETKAKEEIYELTGKLTLLRQQLEDIQKKLIKLETPHTDIILGKSTITKDASAYEKACFLLDLFHGRRDVYAIRRWNRDKEKIFFFPHCINAWTQLCLLKQQKDTGIKGNRPDCSDCKYKRYEELNADLVIKRQLENPFILSLIFLNHLLTQSDVQKQES